MRVYNRALSAGEIQNDMVTSVTPDTVAADGRREDPGQRRGRDQRRHLGDGELQRAHQSEHVTPSTFQLKDSANTVVPANVTYDSQTSVATLTPQAALQYGATYSATVAGAEPEA